MRYSVFDVLLVYCIAVAVCVFFIIRGVASSCDVALVICDKYAMLVVTVELARATGVFALTVGSAGA